MQSKRADSFALVDFQISIFVSPGQELFSILPSTIITERQ